MIDLTPQEKQALLLLEEKQKSDFFQVNSIIHIIGGFLGWSAFILYLIISGADHLLIAILGFIQILLIVAFHNKLKLSPSITLILIILGHLELYIGLLEAFRLELYHMVILEALMTVLAYRYYASSLYHFLQAAFLLLLIFILPREYFHSSYSILILWVLSLGVLIYLWIRPQMLFLSTRVAFIIVQSSYMLLLYFNHDFLRHFEQDRFLASHLLQMLSLTTTLFLVGFILYSFKALRTHPLSIIAIMLTLYLSWFAYQALTLPLLFIALSLYSNERYIRNFSFLLLAIFLIYYYYMLLIPLDQKALILMITGSALLLFIWLIRRAKVIL